MIQEAAQSDNWIDIGIIAQTEDTAKRPAASYKAFDTTVTIEKTTYRAIVVHLSAHDKRRHKRIDRELKKNKEQLPKKGEARAPESIEYRLDVTLVEDASKLIERSMRMYLELTIPREHTIYYHTVNVVAFSAIVLATGSAIDLRQHLRWLMIGLAVLVCMHLVIRTANVLITGLQVEAAGVASMVAGLLAQYLVPVLFWAWLSGHRRKVNFGAGHAIYRLPQGPALWCPQVTLPLQIDNISILSVFMPIQGCSRKSIDIFGGFNYSLNIIPFKCLSLITNSIINSR